MAQKRSNIWMNNVSINRYPVVSRIDPHLTLITGDHLTNTLISRIVDGPRLNQQSPMAEVGEQFLHQGRVEYQPQASHFRSNSTSIKRWYQISQEKHTPHPIPGV
jgi:hypothetical protein